MRVRWSGRGAARMLAAALVAGALGLAACPTRAQVPPDAHWRTLHTEHFRVIYPPALKDLAPLAATDAERAWSELSADFESPPPGTIDLVLSDGADYTNGSSTPLPTNRVIVLATPPAADLELDYYRHWLALVIDHELTHTFHLNRAGTVGHVLRAVFGRVPVGWPFFPGLDGPDWATEGIAVEYETRLTGMGRIAGTYHDMVLRTAALEGRFSSIDRATFANPLWPEGDHAYAYGSRFIHALTRRLGPGTPAAIVNKTTGAVIPPALDFGRVGAHAIGESFTRAWNGWRDTLAQRYARLADSLRATGLTPAETLTPAGRYAFFPRVSPDGRSLVYSAATGRSDPATWILDLATGRRRVLARRNGGGPDLGPASWLPDGSGLITTQFRFRGAYRLYKDLDRIDLHGGEHRLTRGLRLLEPDVAPDGRRVVAVQDTAGSNRLVVYDLRTGRLRPLTPLRLAAQWAYPRWSPDGARIAASRWSPGGDADIVVLDTAGAVRVQITRDRALDRAPAWMPDGRWILFDSDRSGIPNIYAAHPDGSELRQVTNVLTGAFQPEPSPDGRTLFFVGYHADGFHIERMALDTTAWRTPAPLAARFSLPLPRDAAARSAAARATAGSRTTAYSPFPGLAPHFWIPLVTSSGVTGTSYGVASFGDDVVGRHSWLATATLAPSTGRFQGQLSYRWAGLGNPVLGLDASQAWSVDGRAQLPDSSITDIFGREDDLALSATILRPGWRTASALQLGVEAITGHRSLAVPHGFRLKPQVAGIRRFGAFAFVSFSSARAHNFSISREAGASVTLGIRRRWDAHSTAPLAEQYTELVGQGAIYHAFHVFGFANHVIALRASALDRSGATAPTTSLGGASGQPLGFGLGLASLGTSRFLPVRGFTPDARRGTHGWSASLEYRLPLALVAHGHGLFPLFLDDIAATAFLDAGDAWCTADQQTVASCDPNRPAGAHPGHPLVGAGGELALDLAAFYNLDFRLRAGVGVPLSSGPAADGARFYITLGPSF